MSSLHLPSDSEDDETGTQLLPTHFKLGSSSLSYSMGKSRARAENLALADVWDEREELFGVADGDSDVSGDEEAGPIQLGSSTGKAPVDGSVVKGGKSVRWADGRVS